MRKNYKLQAEKLKKELLGTHFEIGAEARAPSKDRHKSTHREDFGVKKLENLGDDVRRNKENKDKQHFTISPPSRISNY
jgi:hypothetical protein